MERSWLKLDLRGEEADPEIFAFLDDRAQRSRFAYLVEMDHFTKEKYDFRLLVLRYLVSRGWSVAGEELPAERAARAECYLRTGDESHLRTVEEPPWFTSGVLATVTQPTDALDRAQARFMRAVRRRVPGIQWFGFDADSSDRDYIALCNAAPTYDALNPAMARREEIMFDRVKAALDTDPGAKIALLAGSTHLLKDDLDAHAPNPGGAGPGGGTGRSVGHRVAHELADGPVLSFWFLHGRGRSANPWNPDLVPQPGTMDARLLADAPEPVVVPIPADAGRGRITQMHNLVLECDLGRQVDAVVFAPRVSPLDGPT